MKAFVLQGIVLLLCFFSLEGSCCVFHHRKDKENVLNVKWFFLRYKANPRDWLWDQISYKETLILQYTHQIVKIVPFLIRSGKPESTDEQKVPSRKQINTVQWYLVDVDFLIGLDP